MKYNAVKVYSATKARDREHLGDRLTDWLDDHPEVSVIDTVVTQSSDKEFHCLSITIFYQSAGGSDAQAVAL